MAILDPSIDQDEFERKHSMQTYRAYHEQYTRENEEMLVRYPDLNT